MPSLGLALGVGFYRPSGESFDPLTLSPAVWLDASQESYIADDPVTTAHDYSGNGRDFEEATNPPIFKTTSAPVRPYFLFSGGQQLIKSYTGAGTDFSVLGVVSRKYDLFQTWFTNGIDPYLGIQVGSQPVFYQGATLRAGLSVYPDDIEEKVLMGVISDNGTTKVVVGRNIVASGATTASALKIGGISSLGGFQWEGHVHEVLATETAMSFTDWNAYEAYVRSKWGLANRRRLIIDGTSINQGSGASIPANAWAALVTTELGSTSWHVTNTAISGQTIGDCTAGGGPAEYALLNAATEEWTVGNRTDGKNVLIIDAPTNDLFYGKTAAQAMTSYVAYGQGAQAAGYYVIVSTMLDRQTSGGSWTRAKQIEINTSIRADWATFADALVDPLVADSRFDDNTSALFADNIHPSDAGHAILADLYSAAIPASP